MTMRIASSIVAVAALVLGALRVAEPMIRSS